MIIDGVAGRRQVTSWKSCGNAMDSHPALVYRLCYSESIFR